MTSENIKAGFRGAGLVPYDPQAVLSRLDVKLRTPTPTRPPSLEADAWVSQTPHNPAEAVSQSVFVQNRISIHQGSSPTSMFSAVTQLAKGTEQTAQRMILIEDELKTLRKANEALAKRRRAKRTRLQVGGALTVKDAQALLAAKAPGSQQLGGEPSGGGPSDAKPATQPRCSGCGKTGHNIRTCQEVEETSDEGSCFECS